MNHTGTNESESSDAGDRIVEQELRRLLESPLFVRSPVLSRLLQYLADHRLRGARSAPKAYEIATEALGRSHDFDPSLDSYPRVMVGRLRNLLDRYYADTPWVHRLRVPQGSYEIVVQHRAAPPPARSAENAAEASAAASVDPVATPSHEAAALPPARLRRGRRTVLLAVLVLAGLAALAGWWAWRGQQAVFQGNIDPMPLVEISAPEAGESAVSRALARALDGKLRDGIRRFEFVDLLSARSREDDRRDRADYRLDSSVVRTVEGPVDVTLVLNRVADQRAIWSTQVRVNDGDVPEFGQLEPAIAQIAGDYGVIVRDQLRRQPDDYAPGYPCLAQFSRMRQNRTAEGARRVGDCLRASVERAPRDPVLLNALSWLRFGDWGPQRGTPQGKAIFAEARGLAERAYENGPNTPAGLFAITRAHFYAGDCAAGEAMGNAAVRLNPYDPDMAGFIGLFKLTCGVGDNGEALLRRSLALDASYAGVPAVTLAFVLSQRGEVDEARAILDGMPSPSNMEPQYLVVRSIVLARQGHLAEGRQLWQRLLTYTRQPAGTEPEKVLGQFMITPAVVRHAAAALRDSSVVPAAPRG
jgi:hypothetical protein